MELLEEREKYVHKSQLRVHKITAKPTLVSGSETWTLRKMDENELEDQEENYSDHLWMSKEDTICTMKELQNNLEKPVL
jgi:hypothetical protein